MRPCRTTRRSSPGRSGARRRRPRRGRLSCRRAPAAAPAGQRVGDVAHHRLPEPWCAAHRRRSVCGGRANDTCWNTRIQRSPSCAYSSVDRIGTTAVRPHAGMAPRQLVGHPRRGAVLRERDAQVLAAHLAEVDVHPVRRRRGWLVAPHAARLRELSADRDVVRAEPEPGAADLGAHHVGGDLGWVVALVGGEDVLGELADEALADQRFGFGGSGGDGLRLVGGERGGSSQAASSNATSTLLVALVAVHVHVTRARARRRSSDLATTVIAHTRPPTSAATSTSRTTPASSTATSTAAAPRQRAALAPTSSPHPASPAHPRRATSGGCPRLPSWTGRATSCSPSATTSARSVLARTAG